MRTYYVEQEETGLFYCDGQWCEEPEFFTHAEALAIVRSPDRNAEPFGCKLMDITIDAGEHIESDRRDWPFPPFKETY